MGDVVDKAEAWDAIAKKNAKIARLEAALTKIQYLEASDADTWIWQAQETAREALETKEARIR